VAGPLIHHSGSLAPALDALRLSLHVLAAAVWVGGQVVLVGLVGTARRISPDAPKAIARSFARLSWPAYAVLIATGVWNLFAVHPSTKSAAWQAVLTVKVVVVVVAGLAAYLHSRVASRRGLALWGSLSGLSALAALVLGVLLAG
jgi:putative copper export protein